MRATVRILLLLAFVLSGCKEGLVEPERFGTIEGRVLDFETRQPVANAAVTTSPATDAITTGDDGAFSVESALVGTYTVTATKFGYQPGTATVAVGDSRSARADVYLRTEEEDSTSSDLVFGAEVLGFTNETFASDSSFVTVEYRALNNGEVAVGSYEVYFRIDTDRGPFYQEVNGADLGPGERDVATFRKRLIGAEAEVVVVEDTAAREVSDS